MTDSAIALSSGGRNDERWFALQVRANHERVVQLSLKTKGYTEFLPVYRKRTRWSDRMKELDLPLFPGYVFGKFHMDNRLTILTIPGVVKIVGAGRKPEPVDDGEVDAIRALVASGVPILPWQYLEVGDKVRIESGALAGLEGVLVQTRSQCRVVVSVNLLQRSVAVDILREWLRPVSFTQALASHIAGKHGAGSTL